MSHCDELRRRRGVRCVHGDAAGQCERKALLESWVGVSELWRYKWMPRQLLKSLAAGTGARET